MDIIPPILGYDAISDEMGVATRIASSILDEYDAALGEGYADGMRGSLANPPDEYSELERAAYMQGWQEAAEQIVDWKSAPLEVLEHRRAQEYLSPEELDAIDDIITDTLSGGGPLYWAEPKSGSDDGAYRILMVCTGNTSRSAIADAAGRALAPPGVEVSSAGTHAWAGSRASEKATRAAADLGIDLSNHRSRELSAALLKAADEVWYMTERHAGDIEKAAPWAAPKLRRLDPNSDIADPHGGSMELYGETAEEVVKAVRTRMAALRLERERERAASRRAGGMSYHRASEIVRGWELGPFAKHPGNPIIAPEDVPLARNVLNPSAWSDGDGVTLFLRVQDEGMTSRIHVARSADGVSFDIDPNPILEPTEDYELPGGCEDPRVAVVDGTAYMTYTGYSGEGDAAAARMCLATTDDVSGWRGWEKHGPVFGDMSEADDGRVWYKAGQVCPERVDGRLWMYWGEKGVRVASSEDGILWEQEPGGPAAAMRPGMFDSDIAEVGTVARVPGGLLLVYNGADASGAYRSGQMLWNAADPRELLERSDRPFLEPDEPLEDEGEVDDVVFSEGLARLGGEWLLYFGMADSRVGVAMAPGVEA